MIFTFPIIVCIQFADLLNAIYRALQRFLAIRRRIYMERGGDDEKSKGRRKKRGCLHRLYRTLKKCCLKCTPCGLVLNRGRAEEKAVGPAEAMAQEKEKNEQRLRELERQRSEQRMKEEAEEQRRRIEEEAERKAQEEEQQKQSPVLSVSAFKAMWSTMGPAGSFQCKLKSPPQLLALTEHLRKQGFHVVFAASPSATDCEVGICNIRNSISAPGNDDAAATVGTSIGTAAGGTESWFMARFVVSQNSFSAVMKCEVPNEVPNHVKRFALAKVLKIDTSAGPVTPASPQGSSKSLRATPQKP